MTALLATLESTDYLIIAAIVWVVTILTKSSNATSASGSDWLVLHNINQNLELLLKHHGIQPPPPPPSTLSEEVQRLALQTAPDGKIAAIKLYREQNPEVGLAEAKTRIEVFRISKGLF